MITTGLVLTVPFRFWPAALPVLSIFAQLER